MIAGPAVHTTGINWESIGSLMAAFTATVGSGIGLVLKRLDRNRDKTQEFVQAQVTSVSGALSGRLDRLDTHLAEQDRTVFHTNERLARVEGRLMIPPPPGAGEH